MTIFVRPRTKFLAALMAAGVVAAAPIVTVPGHDALPEVSNVAVQPASLVTDVLYGLGDAVYAGTWAIGIPADAIVSAPFDGLFSAASVLENPAAIGSILSFLAQRYLNPSDGYPYYTYPWDFKAAVLETLAGLLPSPLSDAAINALNVIADGVGSVLGILPDPTAGADLFDFNRLDTFAGRALYSTQLAILAPVYAIAHAVTWLGYEPAVLEETFEAALQNPANIPGLFSNLVYSVLDPDNGLLGQVAWPFVNVGYYAPSPIGWSDTDEGLAYNAYAAFSGVLTGLLNAVLPTPVVPTPFAAEPDPASLTAAPESIADPASRTEKKFVAIDAPVTDVEQDQVAADAGADVAKTSADSEVVKDTAVKDDTVEAPTKPRHAKSESRASAGRSDAKSSAGDSDTGGSKSSSPHRSHAGAAA